MIFESELLEIPNNLYNLFVETIELYSSMVVRDVVHTFS